MILVWRGLGILVPIVFFICAWLVHYFFDDTHFANPSYSGWVCFYASIVLLLPGLGAFFGGPDEDGVKRKHDFFFIPILFWAIGLGVLSGYLLLGTGSDSDDLSADDLKNEMMQDDQSKIEYRTVNFLNSSDDSLEISYTDKDGKSESFVVSPKSWSSHDLEPQAYTFDCFDMNSHLVSNFPFKSKIDKPTPTDVDYDAAWIQVDGGTHTLVMIDVTEMIPADYKFSDLDKTDWTKRMVAAYDATDVMEPVLPDSASIFARVLEPGDLLPAAEDVRGEVYALITVPSDVKLTNEYLQKRLAELYFE